MIKDFRRYLLTNKQWIPWAVTVGVLLGAALLGTRASALWLGLLVVSLGIVLLLKWPLLKFLTLILAALLIPLEISTGSAVAVNPVTLLIPLLLLLWFHNMLQQRKLQLAPSRVNRSLALFLGAGLLSTIIGNALWDPAVPYPHSFILVQIAQWSIFAFSAGAFWLAGNQITDQETLKQLTFFFLIVAGLLAILLVLSGGVYVNYRGVILLRSITVTYALARAPFWLLLASLAGGQLLFNPKLSVNWRLYLLAILGAIFSYAFYLERQTSSNWVCVTVALGVLVWLRWPRWRWPAVVLIVILIGTGVLTSTVYDFAGGSAEWEESGGSRLLLISRVLQVTMRNPITGLGPAAYRHYARMEPLLYGRALWLEPQISSHNNYVDLFSHMGLVGLALFAWFAAELVQLGLRLRQRFTTGFAAGYVNAMLAAWAGSLTLMLFADWMLPFVYNISFAGFQASVLVWLFLGGLVTLEQIVPQQTVTGNKSNEPS